METRDLARYPFLAGSRDMVADSGVDLESLLTGSAYEEARSRGLERVMDAVRSAELSERPLITPYDHLMEVMGYAVARMIVSAIGDRFLTKRYALAEGVAMAKALGSEDQGTVLAVAEELGVHANLDGDHLEMHFTDFLRLTSSMRSPEWKLVNTEVVDGDARLPADRFARVLQQALQDRIESELPLTMPVSASKAVEPLTGSVRGALESMRGRFEAKDMGEVRTDMFPPCMRRLLAMTQAGENLPHSGRFAITSFLHCIGLSSEGILRMFSTSPDFDESKTLYQIQHITGETSGTEYTPPECSTMVSYGLCVEPDGLCARIKHPLNYYRIKKSPRRGSE